MSVCVPLAPELPLSRLGLPKGSALSSSGISVGKPGHLKAHLSNYKTKTVECFLYTSGISEECQSLRSVTGHNSGPTWFAGLTWSWFTPVKSSSFWEGFMEQLVRGKVSIPAPFSQVGDVSSPLHLSFITGSGDAVPHYP